MSEFSEMELEEGVRRYELWGEEPQAPGRWLLVKFTDISGQEKFGWFRPEQLQPIEEVDTLLN